MRSLGFRGCLGSAASSPLFLVMEDRGPRGFQRLPGNSSGVPVDGLILIPICSLLPFCRVCFQYIPDSKIKSYLCLTPSESHVVLPNCAEFLKLFFIYIGE